MNSLRGIHAGETATIVGTGPSLLRCEARHFAGVIIAINDTILTVRKLGLPNPAYVMEKDGCTHHSNRAAVPIRTCRCPSPWTPAPVLPEILLVSAAESSMCHRAYPLRHVFDVEADFGIRWATSSTPVAARIARWMGCTSLRMIGHDAYTTGSLGRVVRGKVQRGHGRYRSSSIQAIAYARSVGLPVEWVVP